MAARKQPTPPPDRRTKPKPPPAPPAKRGRVHVSFETVVDQFRFAMSQDQSVSSCLIYSTEPTTCFLCGVRVPPKTYHKCEQKEGNR